MVRFVVGSYGSRPAHQPGMIWSNPDAPERLCAPGSQSDSHAMIRATVGHCSSAQPTLDAVAYHWPHGPATGAGASGARTAGAVAASPATNRAAANACAQ